MKKLSCCIIGKNEQNFINKCIKSIQPISDEIIYVDTGSKDNTPTIAKELGAIVFNIKWKNDFSYARNISLENATSDWILILDCDEILEANSYNEIKTCINSTSCKAYWVKITSIFENNMKQTVSNIRLFKNDKHFRFKGKIHEQIIESILEHSSEKNILKSNIHITHYGYNNIYKNIKLKIKRNLKILKLYTEDEKDGFYYFNLASEYLRLGELKKAIEYYSHSLKKTNYNAGYGPMLIKKTAISLKNINQFEDAINLINYFLKIYVNFYDLYFILCLCHLECGRYTYANIYFQMYYNNIIYNDLYPTETFMKSEDYPKLLHFLKTHSIESYNVKLSVCIIVKNEINNIYNCIKSINEIAYEVIVIDTGSNDKTNLLSHQLGAKVYSYKWNNNFSAARNYAINQVSGNWILFLDADEILNEKNKKNIIQLILNPNADAYRFIIYNYMDNELSVMNCFVNAKCRLFKNNGYKFQGIINENIEDSILKNNGIIKNSNIIIHHTHFKDTENNIINKFNTKIFIINNFIYNECDKLLLKGIENFYFKNFSTAIYCFENYFKLIKLPSSKACYFYSLCLYHTKKYIQCINFVTRALTLYSDYADLKYLQSLNYVKINKLHDAIPLLHQYIYSNNPLFNKYTISLDINKFKAVYSLAAIYINLKEYSKALQLLLILCKNQITYDFAIESIVLCFIKNNNLDNLENFILKNNLNNFKTLNIIINTLLKFNFIDISISFMKMNFDLLNNNTCNEDIVNLLRDYSFLLNLSIEKIQKN